MSATDLRPAWPDDVAAAAIKMWKEGRSATEIANSISTAARRFTRNAVIGFMHRHGLQRDLPAAAYRAPRIRKPRSIAPRTPMPKAPPPIGLAPPPPVVDPPAPRTASGLLATARPWTDRGAGQCAWPLAGPGGEFWSCCARIHRGKYCEAHRALVYSARKVDTDELVRSVRRYA